jgi:hypothetical protein
MVPVCGGKFLLRKAIHNCVEKRVKPFADDEEIETDVRKWLRHQSKDLCAVGFDALLNRWVKCISVGGGYVEKLMFFSGLDITSFTFYIHL